MRVVHLGVRFPDDPDHLEVLSQVVDLAVYGTTYHGGPPIQTARADGESGRYPPKLRSSCKTRDFNPRPLIRRVPLFWVFPGLAAALEQDHPDVIHVISEPWGLLAVQAAAWSRRNRSNALVIHGGDRIWWHGGTLEQLTRRHVARWTLARADGYAAESGEAVERARSSGLTPSIPAEVIHTNPRNHALFRPAANSAEKREVRRTIGLPEEGIGIGFMAKFLAHKGPLLFLDALTRVRMDGLWAAIAGAGPLQLQVEAQASTQAVTYAGALAFPDQVVAFFRAIDVFVVPSWTISDWDEQAPRVVIEAMLSACVVVGSACGAIPEMICGAGVVVKERDPDDLARGIAEAAVMAADGRVGARARDLARSRYSTEQAAEQMLRLWYGALERRPRRSSAKSSASS